MKKNRYILSVGIIFAAAAALYLFLWDEKPAITYFPPDDAVTFSEAASHLSLSSPTGNDSYEINWTSSSLSDKPMYLRQDVSLLFDNGRLLGLRSEWEQDTDRIKIREKVSREDSSFYEVVSFHHGEIHYPNDQIKSIQQMSQDQLYVIDSPASTLDSFTTPEGEFEKEWQHRLERTMKQQLLYEWQQLFAHYQIDTDAYLAVPLTSLPKYRDEPLPSMTQEQTAKIIGQLWEGLYKNYIIPAANTKGESLDSYVPIILFHKEKNHLLVLFELNGEKQRLIQSYS